MPRITIDHARCKRDELCIIDCPMRVISKDDNGFPYMRKAAEKSCIACGHCVAVCPHDALHLDDTAPDTLPSCRDMAMDRENMTLFLKGRRSVRHYKKDPVDRELLLSLLDTARFAPSAKNRQPVHWTVLRGRDRVRAAAEATINWMEGDPQYRGIVSAWTKGVDVVLRDAPCVAVAHAEESWPWGREDCTIGVTYLELAAFNAGLGACWAGFLVHAARQSTSVRATLDIPADHIVHGGLMLGYPRFKYSRIPERTPLRVRWLEDRSCDPEHSAPIR